ncbi:hypothetical protein DFH08DRAFT_811851 [Mycena albidolilacea]|uniref:Uncharacterized protein n=1 Tax=Mycena albidolilacea TaxID=1033008 RepID=A0AAD7EML0_9AGAR|nr:hypothetical protein DFH08DRAFT_811851 [Mycena albidolilacea]
MRLIWKRRGRGWHGARDEFRYQIKRPSAPPKIEGGPVGYVTGFIPRTLLHRRGWLMSRLYMPATLSETQFNQILVVGRASGEAIGFSSDEGSGLGQLRPQSRTPMIPKAQTYVGVGISGGLCRQQWGRNSNSAGERREAKKQRLSREVLGILGERKLIIKLGVEAEVEVEAGDRGSGPREAREDRISSVSMVNSEQTGHWLILGVVGNSHQTASQYWPAVSDFVSSKPSISRRHIELLDEGKEFLKVPGTYWTVEAFVSPRTKSKRLTASRVSELLARDFAVGEVAVNFAVQTANATMPSGTRDVVLAVKTWMSAATFELKETKNVETEHGKDIWGIQNEEAVCMSAEIRAWMGLKAECEQMKTKGMLSASRRGEVIPQLSDSLTSHNTGPKISDCNTAAWIVILVTAAG